MAEQAKDGYGFAKMTATELRKVVADITKDMFGLLEDKKTYVAGINDVLKESRVRLAAAIAQLELIERGQADAAHEVRVEEFLAKVEA
jgi:hypothetical protein